MINEQLPKEFEKWAKKQAVDLEWFEKGGFYVRWDEWGADNTKVSEHELIGLMIGFLLEEGGSIDWHLDGSNIDLLAKTLTQAVRGLCK